MLQITTLRAEYQERGKENDVYMSLATCCENRTSPTRAILRRITDTQERRRTKRKHTVMYQEYTERLNIFLSELSRIARAEGLTEIILHKKWQETDNERGGALYLALLDMYESYNNKLAGATTSADAADYSAILDALRVYDPVSALQEKIADRKRKKKGNALLQAALNDLIVLENPALAEAS